MSATSPRTNTGHVIGAVYFGAYWGDIYRVIGPANTPLGHGVEVELVAPNPNISLSHSHAPGSRVTHCTTLADDDVRLDPETFEPLEPHLRPRHAHRINCALRGIGERLPT